MRDGIIYTRNLELDAMEVQFVRGIRMTEEDAIKIRETAEEAGIELHVKAPYYINLAGDERNVEMSAQKILASGKLAHEMGAETVVFHPGFYGDLSKEETMKRVVENLRDIRNVFVREGWKPRLGMEVMGKRNVFGSLEEVIEVCNRVKGVMPVIDFAHIHARGNGILQNPEDFQAVFDRLASLNIEKYLIHFTGIHYENGNARYRLPIKKGDLKFEPLCEVLLENNLNATVISSSPIMEHDAMYMNIVFDRVKERRDQRIAREIRDAAEAEEKAAREAERRAQQEEERRIKEEEKARIAAEKAAQKAAEEAEKQRLKEEEERKKAELEAYRLELASELVAASDVVQTDDTGRRQVTYGDYKLYKKDTRFQFMKAKKEGYNAVFKVPEGKVVEENKQGIPVLRDPPPFRKPKVIQTDDTGRRQVSVDEYKLYKKDNRYYFSKEKKPDFSLVFKVPEGKMVKYDKHGTPRLMNED
ncbi:MAG: TIM barrel protein [Thermoplasmatota archaeon]